MRPTRRAVLAHLAERPYQTAGDIARSMGTSAKAVMGVLRNLERRRLVVTGALWNCLLTWRVR